MLKMASTQPRQWWEIGHQKDDAEVVKEEGGLHFAGVS